MLGEPMGQGRIDRVFRYITLDPEVVRPIGVTRAVLGQPAALALHFVGGLPSANDDLAGPAHRLAVR